MLSLLRGTQRRGWGSSHFLVIQLYDLDSGARQHTAAGMEATEAALMGCLRVAEEEKSNVLGISFKRYI